MKKFSKIEDTLKFSRRLNELISQIRSVSSFIAQVTYLAHQSYSIGLYFIILLQVYQVVSSVTTAFVVKNIFDAIITNNSNKDHIIGLVIIQGILSLTSQLTTHFSTYLNSEMGRRISLTTQERVYKKINSLGSLAYFETPSFHDTLRLASQAVQNAPLQVIYTLTSLINNTLLFISFFGVLIYLNPIFGVLVVFVSMPRLYGELKIGRERHRVAWNNSSKERKTTYLATILTNIHYAKEIRLFNLGDYFLQIFLDITKKLQHIQRSHQIYEFRWQIFLSFLSNASATIAFGIVIAESLLGRISFGDITLYVAALATVQASLSGIFFSFANLKENNLFFAHYRNLISLPDDLSARTPHLLTKLKDGIEFKNLSFRYSDKHPWVLKNINLFLPKGKSIALVGKNGAGKSTLIKLIMRLYTPTEGQILWDGIDIQEFKPDELRSKISGVFQDFVHYDLTAQENIGIGDVSQISNKNYIEGAAKKAGIHSLIDGLPYGYSTVLSRWLVDNDEGRDLSGGQWQKVALARMFMREADLFILDEPTSALDTQSEAEFYSQLTSLIRNQTCLLISHRFSTIQLADLIAVLEDSKIVEYGAHDDLMALNGSYAYLYKNYRKQNNSIRKRKIKSNTIKNII